MMGKWGARETVMCVAGVLLALSVSYCVGKQQGALDTGIRATRDSLAVVVKEKAVIQKQRDSVGKALAEAGKKSAETRTVYVATKAKVSLHGDTAVTKDSSQVLLPEVAERLRDADAHIVNLEAENVFLRAFVHADSALIGNLEQQVRLNQNIAKMVAGSRFSRGVQLGVGVCMGGDGVKRACVYAGYGVEVKL